MKSNGIVGSLIILESPILLIRFCPSFRESDLLLWAMFG